MKGIDIKVEITPEKYNKDGYELHDFIVDYANYNSWFVDDLKYWIEYEIRTFNYKLLRNVAKKVPTQDFQTFQKVGKILREEFENLKSKTEELQSEKYDKWRSFFEKD